WEPARWPVVAFGIGAVLTEFCVVLGRALGAERQYQGPMGKSDRAFLIGALGLLTALLPQMFRFWPWIFGIAVPLLAATCWNRISLVFFGLLSFWAFKEYITLLKTRPADHKALVLAFLAIPIQYLWIAREAYVMFLIFIPVYVFLILPVRLVLSGETEGFVAS